MRPSHLNASLAALALAMGCSSPARIDLDPLSARLYGGGQTVKVHASAFARNGRPLPEEVCRWSSSVEKVVSVKGPHNEATVTAVGPGNAVVRCQIGALAAQLNVSVRYVSRLEVAPARVEVKMLDQPTPTVLEVRALDSEGAPVPGRVVLTRCQNEDVCRGDNRGQIWGVAPGESRVVVEVDEARAEVVAHVIDARTAEGKPRRVKGNPMLDYEKAIKALGK